ncbi:MAG: OB-fold nucleic acid binding domain-containing protein [Candidatus Aenigmatarchaeota archaeon]
MNFEIFVLMFSFISFIIGISLLLYFLYLYEPKELKLSEISEEYLGTRISVTGKIIDIIKRERVNYVIITDEIKNFTITIFPDIFKLIEDKIEIGKTVKITGTLSSYRGNLQIILQSQNNIKIIND